MAGEIDCIHLPTVPLVASDVRCQKKVATPLHPARQSVSEVGPVDQVGTASQLDVEAMRHGRDRVEVPI